VSALEPSFTAVVIGGVDSGESDRVVYLLTTKGRVAAFAPAAKKSRKRFGGALEPFTTILATISPKRRGELYTLESAIAEKARLPLRRDLGTIALASYAVELAGKIAPEGDASADVLRCLEVLLDRLEIEPASKSARVAFELSLLPSLGVVPELTVCAVCGESGERMFLDFDRGGALCERHRGEAAALGPKTAAWLRTLLDPDAAPVPAEWAETAAHKAQGALASYWRTLFDRPLKSEGMLRDLGL
jgi:DNA repair protein RecO (recombination protein O)